MTDQTTDRVAVLREVEQAVRKAAGNCGYKADDGCDFCNGVDAALDQVRRLTEAQPTGTTTAARAAALGLTDTEYRAQSHAAAVSAVRAALPGMYAHVAFQLEDVLNGTDGAQLTEEEAATEPLLFWNETAGVTYQDGRITLHVDQAVNLAQAVPAGSLILQPSAAETLRKALTRALTEAHAPRCPHCGESLADYDTDAYVYRAGDGRPYCSSECVVAAYRAAIPQI